VRLFKRDATDAFVVFDPDDRLARIRPSSSAGVELAIEATDIVRDASQWDGYVDLTLLVDGGTGASGAIGMASDTVRMRVAPVLFRHHLDPAEQVFASTMNVLGLAASSAADLQASMNAGRRAGLHAHDLRVNDQWTQDYFETAYMAMPGPDGEPHAIDVNFRSANHTGGQLRSAGRVVYGLRGPDVGAAVQFDSSHANYMDTLNSFGNFETIPPFSHAG
jgi:protein-arginine deiminase